MNLKARGKINFFKKKLKITYKKLWTNRLKYDIHLSWEKTGVIDSSDYQHEESIEGQLRECKTFNEKNDIQIVEIYIDR